VDYVVIISPGCFKNMGQITATFLELLQNDNAPSILENDTLPVTF
jgi:hypothetical protein